ncbi:hypothetical protein VTN49DRAFT_6144 [Thermomyces lanuginosus]|uniref:uncharacterized protein n=1 Tax=Thermomyces lanuginosus TaxID=5541 RepID=UPI003743F10D
MHTTIEHQTKSEATLTMLCSYPIISCSVQCNHRQHATSYIVIHHRHQQQHHHHQHHQIIKSNHATCSMQHHNHR